MTEDRMARQLMHILYVTVTFPFYVSLTVSLSLSTHFKYRFLNVKNIHYFYSSPNIIRMITSKRMKWVGHVAFKGEMRNVYKLSVGKYEGKRPLRE
jgi:hypothetical protein